VAALTKVETGFSLAMATKNLVAVSALCFLALAREHKGHFDTLPFIAFTPTEVTQIQIVERGREQVVTVAQNTRIPNQSQH
jgi:hypothetical protein